MTCFCLNYRLLSSLKSFDKGPVSLFQRITCSVNSLEQKRLLMDLDVSMRTGSCPYTVRFYGALFREVCLKHDQNIHVVNN